MCAICVEINSCINSMALESADFSPVVYKPAIAIDSVQTKKFSKVNVICISEDSTTEIAISKIDLQLLNLNSNFI